MQDIEALLDVIDDLKAAIWESKTSEITDRVVINQLNELDYSATVVKLRLQRQINKTLQLEE